MANTEDYPLLRYPDLMLALLRVGLDGAGRTATAVAHIEANLRRADIQPEITGGELEGNLQRARRHLAEARLIAENEDGTYRTVERGKTALRDHPMGIDDTVLMAFPEFRAYVQSRGGRAHACPGRSHYMAGYSAFREGCHYYDNPFDIETVEHLAWENGWFQAADEVQVPSWPGYR